MDEACSTSAGHAVERGGGDEGGISILCCLTALAPPCYHAGPPTGTCARRVSPARSSSLLRLAPGPAAVGSIGSAFSSSGLA